VVVVVLLALWVAQFVWGRVSRSNALRSYTAQVFNAGRPFFTDIQQGNSSMQQTVANFANHTINAKALATAAGQWQKDFSFAETTIAGLKPPSELREAQHDLLIALADYGGVAELYVAVQKQSDLADSIPASLKVQKKAATDQLTLLLQDIADARSRADTIYTAGIQTITNLAATWHVKITNPFPPAPGQTPSPTSS
jgi:hypothetical protein